MAEITDAHIEAAYEMARRVRQGRLSISEGAVALNADTGMNATSAAYYIHDYLMMIDGRRFTRAMSAESHRRFLANIQRDDGAEALQRALIAAHGHVEYYEGKFGTSLQKVRDVLAGFEKSEPELMRLSDEERHLLHLYKRSSAEGKVAAVAVLRALMV